MTRTPFYSETQVKEALRRAFLENGLEEITARKISKRIGCSTMVLYRFFDTTSQMQEYVIEEALKPYKRSLFEKESDSYMNNINMTILETFKNHDCLKKDSRTVSQDKTGTDLIDEKIVEISIDYLIKNDVPFSDTEELTKRIKRNVKLLRTLSSVISDSYFELETNKIHDILTTVAESLEE